MREGSGVVAERQKSLTWGGHTKAMEYIRDYNIDIIVVERRNEGGRKFSC